MLEIIFESFLTFWNIIFCVKKNFVRKKIAQKKLPKNYKIFFTFFLYYWMLRIIFLYKKNVQKNFDKIFFCIFFTFFLMIEVLGSILINFIFLKKFDWKKNLVLFGHRNLKKGQNSKSRGYMEKSWRVLLPFIFNLIGKWNQFCTRNAQIIGLIVKKFSDVRTTPFSCPYNTMILFF